MLNSAQNNTIALKSNRKQTIHPVSRCNRSGYDSSSKETSKNSERTFLNLGNIERESPRKQGHLTTLWTRLFQKLSKPINKNSFRTFHFFTQYNIDVIFEQFMCVTCYREANAIFLIKNSSEATFEQYRLHNTCKNEFRNFRSVSKVEQFSVRSWRLLSVLILLFE